MKTIIWGEKAGNSDRHRWFDFSKIWKKQKPSLNESRRQRVGLNTADPMCAADIYFSCNTHHSHTADQTGRVVRTRHETITTRQQIQGEALMRALI